VRTDFSTASQLDVIYINTPLNIFIFTFASNVLETTDDSHKLTTLSVYWLQMLNISQQENKFPVPQRIANCGLSSWPVLKRHVIVFMLNVTPDAAFILECILIS